MYGAAGDLDGCDGEVGAVAAAAAEVLLSHAVVEEHRGVVGAWPRGVGGGGGVWGMGWKVEVGGGGWG